MPQRNRVYRSSAIPNYYRSHRVSWDAVYPSEKRVFERLGIGPDTRVLDIGCACGGLGRALHERFGTKMYTGVEINPDCREIARELCPWGEFHTGDFLEIAPALPRDFDVGMSMSCADWNECTEALLATLFDHLAPDGTLVLSVRLSNRVQPGEVLQTEQAVAFGPEDAAGGECAPYKVYSLAAMLQLLTGLGAIRDIYGYGYWGTAPDTVRNLPFREIFYLVLAVQKGAETAGPPRLKLDIAADFLVPA